MKKYIEPSMEVVMIETQHMLALSSGSNPLDPSNKTDTYDSRAGRYADEEEEEEW